MRFMKVLFCVAILAALSMTFGAPAGNKNDHGFDLSNMDTSGAACTNFYQYADGGWIAKNPIPPEFPSWGTFLALREHNREVLHQILESAEKNTTAKAGSNEQKIGDYYASCMDESAVEAAGLKPLQPELDRIDAIKDTKDLESVVATLQAEGVRAIFRVGSEPDFADSTQEIAAIDQDGLGLPERDYYTREDDKSKETREEYVKHIAAMFALAGDDPTQSASEAQTVMDIETRLAKASLSRVQRRDPHAIYHKMSPAEVRTLAPNFPWDDYFQATHLAGRGDINVAVPEFFKEMSQMVESVPISDWKVYLRWHLLDATAQALPDKFMKEDFHFYQNYLSGTKEIEPRWKRCVSSTDRELGFALGQVYVKEAFPPKSKARMHQLVMNLEAALREDIGTLSWMSAETKQKALQKLNAIENKIGYPDKWRDYSALNIDRGPYVRNLLRSDEFETNREINKIGKPVDRTEWGMTPPTVNAYYNPLMNEIVFPAGILQPPFFNPLADDAVNYGAIGAVIGHEISHGFDDQGSQFDAQGNLKNWWTPDDLKNFKERAACVVNQFNGYTVEGDLHENGKLVVGESIGDLGGLAIAYAAFQKTKEAKSNKKIDGFTPDQRFYLGYAQVWASNSTPQRERLQTHTDPHPLPRFRVNGPLSNLPAFAKAFDCKPGDPMVRPEDERCLIW
jgi:putative endopeptidase